jgi:hypothetical protein
MAIDYLIKGRIKGPIKAASKLPKGLVEYAGEKDQTTLRGVQIGAHIPVGRGADYSDYVDQAGSHPSQRI